MLHRHSDGLFIDRDCCEDGTIMRIAGWGAKDSKSNFAPTLQEATTRFKSTNSCKKEWILSCINPFVVCAGSIENPSTLCNGDTGAPMILSGGTDDILIGIGIVESGSDCEDRPPQFLKIAPHLEWIVENVPSLSKRRIPNAANNLFIRETLN